MLGFFFGRSVSGRTERIMAAVKERVDAGREDVVLLVPEQSSFDYERRLLRTLGDGKYTCVPVLSFTRLSDEVGRFCGGISGKRLSECGRIVLMSRAVSAVADRLCFFGKNATQTRFIESLLTTVGEFKRCGIDTAAVCSYAQKLTGGMLTAKLLDIALLTDTYDALTKGEFTDPCDDMLILERQLSEYAYFSGKTVYVDAFKNFTGAQLKILEQVIRQADDVYFSFCFDSSLAGENQVFANVGATVKKLTAIAEKYGVQVAAPTVISETFYNDEALSVLERGLCGKDKTPHDIKTDAVTVCRADDIYDEAEFVASHIRRLVRTEGYRYRDFVIIARGDETYRPAIEHMCRRFDIPCFTDKRHSLLPLPLTVFLMSAMRATQSLETEDILRFLKTGLADVTREEVDIIENYVYVWNIQRGDWCREWDMNPAGFEAFGDREKEELIKLEELRQRAISPLLSFRRAFSGSATEMASALWSLVENCNVSRRLSSLGDELPPTEADLNRQSFDAVIEILDSLVDTLGDASCTPAQFAEYFEIAAAGTDIGTIPQMLDEVTFGAADRIKPRDPKVVFAVGMNQGVFPATATSGGIIAGSERGKLLRLGMPLTDYTVGFSIDEEYLLYTTLSCATDRVYVSYRKSDASGAVLSPSSAIAEITSLLPSCRVLSHGDCFTAEGVETAASSFLSLLRNLDGGPLCQALLGIYGEMPIYRDRLDAIDRLKNGADSTLTPQTAERLFGRRMDLSATKTDTYFKCAFSYFCRYGLRAKVLKPAEIDVLQRGTIVHYVLEKLITVDKGRLISMTDDEISHAVNDTVDEYLSHIKGLSKVADNRFAYTVSTIKTLSAELLCHIRNEFAQSGFTPVSCEMKIGTDGELPGPEICAQGGGTVTLNGAIDRVDRFGAYIRIVDYKTGSRKFHLSDVLHGLNMQMLLYLYSVVTSERFANTSPAGILYLEAKKQVDSDNNFRMNGLLCDNGEVIQAMEPSGNGKYIPPLTYNKDGSLSKRNSTYINGEVFPQIFTHIEKLLRQMNENLRNGKIAADPLDGIGTDACKYCDFASVCGTSKTRHRKVASLSREEINDFLKGEQPNV